MQHLSWDSNVVTQPMTYPQKRSTTAQHPGQHPRVHLCPAVVFGKSLELSFAIPHDTAWRCESKGAHWLGIYHDSYICFSYMFRNNSLINFWMSWGIIAQHTLNVEVGSTQVEVIAVCNGEYIYIYSIIYIYILYIYDDQVQWTILVKPIWWQTMTNPYVVALRICSLEVMYCQISTRFVAWNAGQ